MPNQIRGYTNDEGDQSALNMPFTALVTSAYNVGSKMLSYLYSDDESYNMNEDASLFYSEYAPYFESDFDARRLQEGYDSYGAGSSSTYGDTSSSYGGSTYDMGKATVKTDKGVVDYTILSVAVLTLGLLLVVETFFHQLDHLAHHRKFLTTVMSTFYKELAILGIVEWAVFMLTTYYKGMNKAKKSLFAKVHFALFYTAILNVFTSGIIYAGCRMETNRLWVKTEELELDHYIELREEFDRIQSKVAEIKTSQKQKKNEKSTAEDFYRRNVGEQHDEEAEEPLTLKNAWRNVKQRIRHPMLINRYNKLLTQVRFHELRMHFIDANNLPLKFKVSDYLYKCEQNVLGHTVHLSATSWIILMALSNLTYFILSMVVVGTENMEKTNSGLTIVFYGACGGMVALSFLILRKVKWIFAEIMHQKMIDCDCMVKTDDEDEETASSKQDFSKSVVLGKTGEVKRGERFTSQLDLFWFRNPKAVMKAIQFMQFGFAIALSTCIIFWSDINKATKYKHNSSVVMTIVCLVCMGMFLFLTTLIVPRFTLCTNLGQLVNKTRLLQMVASYRLEESIKRRTMEQREKEEEERLLSLKRRISRESSWNELQKEKEEGMSRDSCRYSALATLVAKPTESLPKKGAVLSSADDRKNRRKLNRRALSDGVAAMRSLNDVTKPEDDSAEANPTNSAENTSRPRRARMKAMSEGVSAMRSPDLNADEDDSTTKKASGSKTKASAKPSLGEVMEDIPIMTTDASNLNITIGRATMEGDDLPPPHVTAAPQDSKASTDLPAKTVGSIPLCAAVIQVNKSNGSEAGGYNSDSDVEDIPEVKKDDADGIVMTPKRHHSKPLDDKIRTFFGSTRYRYLSFLLGTMAAFFIVNLRMEFLLVYGDGMVIKTWLFETFNPTVFYWMEVGWLSYFIVESVAMIKLFSPSSLNGKHGSSSPWMQYSGFFGATLAAVCLVLLVVAEAKRSPEYGSFGSRIEAGVGSIEPYTGLIFFYFLRLPFGKKIWKRMTNKKDSDSSLQIPGHSIHKTIESEDNHHHGHGHGHHGGHGSGHGHGHGHPILSEIGTTIELWQKAISMFPDVVEAHGEFSSELLQAMLGVPIVTSTNKSHNTKQVESEKDLKTASTVDSSSNKDRKSLSSLDVSIESELARRASERDDHAPVGSSLNLDKPYSSLSPEAQAVIFAGQVGHPVKPIGIDRPPYAISRSTSDDGLSSHKSLTGLSNTNDAPKQANIRRTISAPVTNFEIDVNADLKEKFLDNKNNSILIEPNATLIRSMRRCERKLPSILDHWAIVDVAITKYELVYFDATTFDDDAAVDESSKTELINKRGAVRDALIATKGGKKLRLRDVALGRKIVGHIDLRKVDMVKLLRYEAGHNQHDPVDNKVHSIESEYWKPTAVVPANQDDILASNKRRWECVQEDVLKIHSTHGVLLLRFLSDLEFHEAPAGSHAHSENNEPMALLWCQTIGRLCGAAQLKQDLPHFGQQGEQELLDYIEHASREPEHLNWWKLKTMLPHAGGGHRRAPSSGRSTPQRGRPNVSRDNSRAGTPAQSRQASFLDRTEDDSADTDESPGDSMV